MTTQDGHNIDNRKYKCDKHGIHEDYICYKGNIDHPLANMKLCWICIYEFFQPLIGNMELVNDNN